MKLYQKSQVVILILSGSLLLSIGSFQACKSTDTPTIIYKTSAGANITAVAALKAWNNYLAENDVPVDKELKVQAAYDKYKVTQHSLLVFAAAVSTNAPGVNTNMFDVHIANSSVALNELVSLLLNFGVKF